MHPEGLYRLCGTASCQGCWIDELCPSLWLFIEGYWSNMLCGGGDGIITAFKATHPA